MIIVTGTPVIQSAVVTWLSTGAGNNNTSVGTGGALSTSWSQTITTSGANVVAVVAAEYWIDVGGSLTLTATYGGTTMTNAGSSVTTAGSPSITFGVVLFYLFNPPSGAQTVQFSVTGSVLKYLAQGSSTAYGNATGTSNLTTLASTSSTSPSLTVTSTSASIVVAAFDRIRTSTTAITAETGTSRYYDGGQISPVTAGVTAEYIFLSMQDTPGSASVNVGVTATTGTSRGIGLSID